MDNLDRIRDIAADLRDGGIRLGATILALCDRVAEEDIGPLAKSVGELLEENARLRKQNEVQAMSIWRLGGGRKAAMEIWAEEERR